MEGLLNEKEVIVLNACVEEVKGCTGTEFGYSDEVSVSGMNKKEVAGYLSQLSQKRFIVIEDEFKQMHLTSKTRDLLKFGENDFDFFEIK